MSRTGTLMLLALILPVLGGVGASAKDLASMRNEVPLTEQGAAPPMAKPEDTDRRRMRAYPEQPPTIPHSIRDYQINLNSNKCMSCHARIAVERSQAPMVSVTHFMNRDGQMLAVMSPRRYFCTQCHVPQTDAWPVVESRFRDVADILRQDINQQGQ